MRLLLLLLAVIGCLPTLAHAQSPDAREQNRRLGRGVNILGYDPIWRSRDRARFREKHFRLIREAGFQSVRINLHPFRHMRATNDWTLPAAWWDTVDWAVAEATTQGLQVILDLHEFNAMGQDPVAGRPQFLAFWKQLAGHYLNAPDSVLFEILNEPSRALTPGLWNEYLREALSLIRPTHPNRTVIVGPAFWNSVDHLDELDLPAGDRHLIVTIHYYKPMGFTHQGAPWSAEKDKSGITWGTEAEQQAVQADFARVTAWAREHGRPIFLGEFGVYDKAPSESRVRYLDFVTRTAEASGWSWAYWQFDSDFVLYDVERDAWVEPILRALVPRER